MAQYDVPLDTGWAGIASALCRAQPGDRVVLSPGDYIGAEALEVPTGVTLQGTAGARLIYNGEEAAILINQAKGVYVNRIELVGYATLADIPADVAEPDEHWRNGLITINKSSDITISACQVRAFAKRRAIIAANGSKNIYIVKNQCSGARRGIVFRSTSGIIIQNETSECLFSGIMLQPDPLHDKAGSRAIIRENRSSNNTEAGIVLSSSQSDLIEDNECWGNGLQGILLQRDPYSPGEPSIATIRSNRCHDNTQTGIALLSSQSNLIEGNECWGNGLQGISLERDPKSTDQPSIATIRSNRCHDNTQTGIALLSSQSDLIEGNECWGNGLQGISLERDSDSPGEPSIATIRSNRCHDNTQAGIALLSSQSDLIEGNECWGNGLQGISLERDSDSPGEPSIATIRSNRCHDNTQAGIALLSSQSDVIEGNECWGNGLQGISLERDPKSTDQPSIATIRSNRCHDNTQAGIALLSSQSDLIEGNECWGNGLQGISLERDSDSPGEPSIATIRSNRCHDNTQAGIALLSSQSDVIEGNECWGNRLQGISLERDSRSPGEPSVAMICGNRLIRNANSGIRFHGALGKATGNRFFGNGTDGAVFDDIAHVSMHIRDRPDLDTPIHDKGAEPPEAFSLHLYRAIGHLAPSATLRGLGGFLATGCSGCFRTFWNHNSHYSSPADTDTANSARAWRLTAKHPPTPINLHSHAVSEAIASRIVAFRDLKQDVGAPVRWIALVAPDDNAPISIAAAVRNKAAKGLTTDATHLAIDRPVVVDLADNSAPLSKCLTRAWSKDRGRWRDRLHETARGPAWLLVIAVLTLTGAYFTHNHRSLAGFFRWLLRFVSEDYPGSMTAGIIFFIFVSNLWLPPHLRFFAHGQPDDADRTDVAKGPNAFVFDLLKWLSKPAGPAIVNWRELSWQRRRMLHDEGHCAVIVLRNLEAWNQGRHDGVAPLSQSADIGVGRWDRWRRKHEDDSDLAWLTRLVPDGKQRNRLVVLLHVVDALSVQKVIQRDDTPWASGIDLFLDTDVQESRIDPNAASRDDDARAYVMLGARTIDEMKLRRTQIASKEWSVFDLIPTLPLASTPTARLNLQCRNTKASVHQIGDLKETFSAARAFFEGSESLENIGPGEFQSLLDLAYITPAIDTSTLEKGSLTYTRLAGRIFARRTVFDLVRSLCHEDRNWQTYICGALRFGIWKQLNSIEKRFAGHTQCDEPVYRTLRELEGIRYLGEDLDRIVENAKSQGVSCEIFGQEMLDGAWSKVRDTITHLPAGPDHDSLIACLLSAEFSNKILSDKIIDRLVDRITSFSRNNRNFGKFDEHFNAVEQFCRATAARIEMIASLDVIARDNAMALESQLLWKNLPPSLMAAIGELCKGRGDLTGLTDRFAHAKCDDDLADLVRMHNQHPVRTIYSLCLAAVNHVKSGRLGDDQAADRLAPVARSLVNLRDNWAQKDPHFPKADLPFDFAAGAYGVDTGGSIALNFFGNPNATSDMARWSTPSETQIIERFRAELNLKIADIYLI